MGNKHTTIISQEEAERKSKFKSQKKYKQNKEKII